MQRGPCPGAGEFGLGGCRPGAGGEQDDQHDEVSDQAHDGLRSGPERDASPGGSRGRRTTFVAGKAPDLTATLRLLPEPAEAWKCLLKQPHAQITRWSQRACSAAHRSRLETAKPPNSVRELRSSATDYTELNQLPCINTAMPRKAPPTHRAREWLFRFPIPNSPFPALKSPAT
ncbi:hypothetical protein TR80_002885 [Xanthomonas campestris]|nr:hypothetical protein TR80_002885 [Xanthomonas campestris]